MSIHAHKKARMQAKMDNMIKDIDPLNDWIYLHGYNSLDNTERKEYAELKHRISNISHKINHISPVYYGSK